MLIVVFLSPVAPLHTPHTSVSLTTHHVRMRERERVGNGEPAADYAIFIINFSHRSAWIHTLGCGTMRRPREWTGRAQPSPWHQQYMSHPSYGTYHLLKKDHRHPKARGDKFLTTIILPTSYIARYLSTYNADLEEIERPTSRGTGEERGWER